MQAANSPSRLDWRGGLKRRFRSSVEAPPLRWALLVLNLDIPELGGVLEVEGSHPDLLLLDDVLLMEEGFTAIDERQGV